MIKIDELSMQYPGKCTSNGGLASTHHPDQKDRDVMGQRACRLGQILRVEGRIRVAGGVRLGRKRFSIHDVIIPLTAQRPKQIRANPRKTFKMFGNEQI